MKLKDNLKVLNAKNMFCSLLTIAEPLIIPVTILKRSFTEDQRQSTGMNVSLWHR